MAQIYPGTLEVLVVAQMYPRTQTVPVVAQKHWAFLTEIVTASTKKETRGNYQKALVIQVMTAQVQNVTAGENQRAVITVVDKLNAKTEKVKILRVTERQ